MLDTFVIRAHTATHAHSRVIVIFEQTFLSLFHVETKPLSSLFSPSLSLSLSLSISLSVNSRDILVIILSLAF